MRLARCRAVNVIASVGGARSSSFIAFCTIGCALLLFVAAGPWIMRQHDYAVFIPAVAASGLLTVAATSLAPQVDARATA